MKLGLVQNRKLVRHHALSPVNRSGITQNGGPTPEAGGVCHLMESLKKSFEGRNKPLLHINEE